jgi:hypothetical protein
MEQEAMPPAHGTFFSRQSRDRFRHMSEVGVVVNHYGVALDIPFSDTVESSFS